MAALQLTHAPILNSNAQILILPVNNAGILLDSILLRSKTLYPDNYQSYFRACRTNSLKVGSCLIHKYQREHAGLGASTNSNQPSYIANLIISDHPYHPTRAHWLNAALIDLQQQLKPLIRYQGIRKIALLAHPLVHASSKNNNSQTVANGSSATILSVNSSTFEALDWHKHTLPLLTQQLQDLPRVRIDLHLPKSIAF